MHREGISSLDTVYEREILIKIKPHIEGIMSHLSTPDNISTSDTQIETFQSFLCKIEDLGIRTPYQHIAASGGIIHAHQYT